MPLAYSSKLATIQSVTENTAPPTPTVVALDDNSSDQTAVVDQNTSTAHSSQPGSSIDPRHLRRIRLMQNMFAYVFHQDEALRQQFEELHPEVVEVLPHLVEIDADITRFAPERPISEINKVDLAILRIIMFEWKTSKTPKKVLIDEAVELAKEFGTESSSRFVNGVLGQLFT